MEKSSSEHNLIDTIVVGAIEVPLKGTFSLEDLAEKFGLEFNASQGRERLEAHLEIFEPGLQSISLTVSICLSKVASRIYPASYKLPTLVGSS